MGIVQDHGGIQNLLITWGRCRAMHDAGHVGYPKRSAFAAQLRSSGQATVRVGPMPDETLVCVDQAVSALKQRCDEQKGDHRYSVLRYFYCCEDHGLGTPQTLTERAIARRLRVSRERVMRARAAAESWVESRLALADPV